MTIKLNGYEIEINARKMDNENYNMEDTLKVIEDLSELEQIAYVNAVENKLGTTIAMNHADAFYALNRKLHLLGYYD